jgi:hypothetical protein
MDLPHPGECDDHPAQRATVLALCRKVGMRPCNADRAASRPSFLAPYWTGRQLLYNHRTSATDLCHELAHFLLARPRHRRRPNYGLGDSVYRPSQIHNPVPVRLPYLREPPGWTPWHNHLYADTPWRMLPHRVDPPGMTWLRRKEEGLASLLGITLEYHLGVGDWQDTFVEHQWNDHDHPWRVLAYLGLLTRRRLVRDGRPTCLARLKP